MGGSKKYTVTTRSERKEQAQRQREQRAIKRAHASQRKAGTYLEDDEELGSWRIQLNKLGLEIRDIPGDGNCLFRALGDQMDGHTENHLRYRSEVCLYMSDHQGDFAPFLDEDISFDKYVSLLRKPATYAGNDALVAFAHLYNVTIVIHQLDTAMFKIDKGGVPSARELHLAYHNGEHYSSVRRVGDKSRQPANIRIRQAAESPADDANVISGLMQRIPTEDREAVTQCLRDFDGDVEAAFDYLQSVRVSAIVQTDNSSTNTMDSVSTIDSGLGSEKTSLSDQSDLPSPAKPPKPNKKQTKSEKKREKKKRAELRHKTAANPDFKVEADQEHEPYEVTSQLALLSV